MNEFGVYIGRFQPFHNAHLKTIEFALTKVNKLIMVIGGENESRSRKDPFLATDRTNLIALSLDAVQRNRLMYYHAQNFSGNNDQWATAIKKTVAGMTKKSEDIVLFGHEKDESSFYLSLFSEWKLIDTGSHGNINSIEIREALFDDRLDDIANNVSPFTLAWLKHFRTTEEFASIELCVHNSR